MEINHKDMVKKLSKPGANIIGNLNPSIAHILHMAIGVSGEVAELLEGVFKEDLDNCKEELGDIEFYFEGLCQGLKMKVDSKSSPNVHDPQRLLFLLVISAGDILDLTKKIAIYNDQRKMPGLRQAVKRFREVVDSYYAILGITQEQALDANIKKLGKRYVGFDYTDQAARTRADKKEGV